jgi:hypothetical protein
MVVCVMQVRSQELDGEMRERDRSVSSYYFSDKFYFVIGCLSKKLASPSARLVGLL